MLILVATSLLAPLLPGLLHLAYATGPRVVGTLAGLALANALMVVADDAPRSPAGERGGVPTPRRFRR